MAWGSRVCADAQDSLSSGKINLSGERAARTGRMVCVAQSIGPINLTYSQNTWLDGSGHGSGDTPAMRRLLFSDAHSGSASGAVHAGCASSTGKTPMPHDRGVVGAAVELSPQVFLRS